MCKPDGPSPIIHKTAQQIWHIALDSWDLNVELSKDGIITYQSAWEREFVERVERELETLFKEVGDDRP